MAAPRPRARGRAWILGPGLALALGIGLAAAAPSQDQESRKREELQRVEDELKASHERHEQLDRDAKDLAHELDDLRGRLVIAGRSTRDNEAALSALETTLAKLEKEAAAKTALLALHREELGALLGALQRLAIHPPEAMLALPQPPRDTVRSAMLLEATLPRVDAQVKELKGELDDLARVQRDVAHQRAMVQSAVGHLSDQRRSLDRLLQRKAALERRTVAEADRTGQRAEQLASTARDLKDLIDKLVQEREAEQARHAQEAKRADEARQLEALRRSGAGTAVAELTPGAGRTLPAAGRILSTYGTQTDFGPSAQGITIETRPDAVVVAPWAGRVMFAGPFRGYGQILIIEHADGYHSLIAGLGHIDTDVGRSLATGEPVGSMGRPPDRNPTLYFELRHHGQPVNPQPWLAAEQVR